jgi:hypothetical protein
MSNARNRKRALQRLMQPVTATASAAVKQARRSAKAVRREAGEVMQSIRQALSHGTETVRDVGARRSAASPARAGRPPARRRLSGNRAARARNPEQPEPIPRPKPRLRSPGTFIERGSGRAEHKVLGAADQVGLVDIRSDWDTEQIRRPEDCQERRGSHDGSLGGFKRASSRQAVPDRARYQSSRVSGRPATHDQDVRRRHEPSRWSRPRFRTFDPDGTM